MTSRSPSVTAPLTFDLPESLVKRIESCRDHNDLKSASEVVRLAIEQFDFAACKPDIDPHRQISVRIPTRDRTMLRRIARQKGVSVGELLRLALEEYSSAPAPSKRGKK